MKSKHLDCLSLPGERENLRGLRIFILQKLQAYELTVLIYILLLKVEEMFLEENPDEIEFQDMLEDENQIVETDSDMEPEE